MTCSRLAVSSAEPDSSTVVSLSPEDSTTSGSVRATSSDEDCSQSGSPARSSSTTSESSELTLFDPSMSSSEASRARERARPVSVKASDTPRPFCGGRCDAPLANYNLDTSSLRMWRTFSVSMTEPFGERFLGTWPRSGSMQSGIVSPLRASAPRTSVTGSLPLLPTVHGMPKEGQARRPGPTGNELGRAITSLLPTPLARNHGGTPVSSESREGGKMIEEAISQLPRLLPTPRADPRDATARKPREGWRPGLMETVQLLPTPAKADAERASDTYAKGNPTLKGALSSGASTRPPSDDGSKSTGQRLHLSPEFVEWMMGMPSCGVCGRGWTDPDCPHSVTVFTCMSHGSQENESSSLRSNG